jgi:transposase
VGLDVHKATIAVALAEETRTGDVRFFGEIPSTPVAMARLVEKLAAKHTKLHFCYEAGPCGYGVHRQIAASGHGCDVVAPSLIPKRPGDHVKTDRRDCVTLAKLLRAGELTPVWVPDAAHEAMRDLVRARLAAMETLRRARQQLHGFLLRHGRVYSGGKPWAGPHWRWLARVTFEQPAQTIVLQECIQAVKDIEARRDRFAEQIESMLPSWSLAPLVHAFQAMRGVALLAAVTLAAEIGDFARFETPKQLMAYVGLVPSEHSSGRKTRRGGITKAGNTHVRRVLVESAWTYRFPARVSEHMLARVDAAPKAARDIAWKAQTRLCARHRALGAKGKPRNVVATAVAREMLGFIWAIAREVKIAPARA